MSGGAFVASFVWRIAEKWRAEGIGKRITRKLFPKLAARREAKRQARKATEFVDDKETGMLTGYKTYLGIATAAVGFVLGWLGLGETEASSIAAQIMGALDQVLQVGGLVLAAYGRAKAKPTA